MATTRTLLALAPALFAATMAAQSPGGHTPFASSRGPVPGLGDTHATRVPTYKAIQMPSLGQQNRTATAFDLDPSFDPRFPTSKPVMVGGSLPDSLPISVVRAVGYFTNGSTMDLGVPLSTAFGMNSHGTIVGYSGDTGFRYARGAWTILHGLTRYSRAYAWAVNSNDIVVGSASGWRRSISLYWTPDNQVHELRTGTDSSWLADINDKDVVAGSLRYPWSTDLAFTMKVDGIRPTLLPPPFPGVSCIAAAINDAGDVVGDFPLNGAYQPVLWSHGLAIPLPVLPNEGTGGARPADINNHGVIVGSSNWYAAVVWIDGAIYNLNDLTPDFEPLLGNARAINDWGVIACEADGRATLLIPN